MPEITKIQTKKQRRAQAAHPCVGSVKGTQSADGYSQLAKRFPALVHTCGLAEATAFVEAKEGPTGTLYLQHLVRVMGLPENTDLHRISREAVLLQYQLLTREIIESATWLKRYSEALL